MTRRLLVAAVAALALLPVGAARAPAQAPDSAQGAGVAQKEKGKKGDKKKGAKADKPVRDDLADTARLAKRERRASEVAARFWDRQTPLELTLTTDIRRLRGDRNENAQWRPATVAYRDSGGRTVTVPMRVRTRGFWRLKNCRFPPLRFDFAEKDAKGTVFEGIDRPKLVSVCANDDASERYILQEFQLYRVQQALTSASHKARLAHITYANADGKPEMTRWAFLIEEPEAVAARLRGTIVVQQGARAEDLEPKASAMMGVFQYLIGNTDFSIGNLHNVELVRVGYGVHVPVAYDFDYAGAVNTWYAKPPVQLPIKRVTERMFRGECTPAEDLRAAVSLVQSRKDAIYALYADSLGKLLPPNVTKETLSYFDEFFKETANPGNVQRRIVDACLGTKP